MGNRTGIYTVFHAGGTTDPTASDIRYYNLMKGWDANESHDFGFVNSHSKTNAVRDTSQRDTLKRALVARLNMSKSVVLIATQMTRNDTDWVPFELQYAIESCGLPIIVAYPNHDSPLSNPPMHLLPDVLQSHINKGTVRTISVPFRQKPLYHAIDTYSVRNMPSYAIGVLATETYRKLGEAG